MNKLYYKLYMNNSSINFNNFINEFYTNYNNKHMIIELLTDNQDNPTETTIYDVHTLLLELLLAAPSFINKSISDERCNIDFTNNLDNSIKLLQFFFDNIKITVSIVKYTISELVNTDIAKLYENRYMRFDSNNNFIINGSHKSISNNLEDIYSFYIDNSNSSNNTYLSFCFIKQ